MRRDQILLHITANLELYRNTELMFPSSSDKLQLEALLRLSARDCFTCRQDVCVCVECVFSLFSCPHGTPFRQLSTSPSPSSEHNHRHCYRHLHSRILSVSLSETDTVAAAGWWRRSCSLRMLWRHRVSMQQEDWCAYRSSWRAPVMTFARGGGGGGLCHTDRPYPPPPAHPTPGSVPDSSFSSLPSKGTAAFSLVGRSVGRSRLWHAGV